MKPLLVAPLIGLASVAATAFQDLNFTLDDIRGTAGTTIVTNWPHPPTGGPNHRPKKHRIHTPKPSKPAGPVVFQRNETPTQSLMVAVRDERGRAVAHAALTVRGTESSRTWTKEVTTDEAGHLALRSLEGFPVSVRFEPEAETAANFEIADGAEDAIQIKGPEGDRGKPYKIARHGHADYYKVPYSYGGFSLTLRPRHVLVSVKGPPGATIGCPALDRSVELDQEGRATLTLSRDFVEKVGPPILCTTHLAGGESESVLIDYAVDPYGANEEIMPPAVLVKLNNVKLPGGVSVLDSLQSAEIAVGQHLPAPKVVKGKPQIEHLQPDGTQLWELPQMGITLSLRQTPFARQGAPVTLVDSIVLNTPAAGSVGGLAVGESREQVHVALGPPQRSTTDPVSGAFEDDYLEGGIAFLYSADKIHGIQIRRPTELLLHGTTAYVPRRPVPLYIESFKCEGNPPILQNDEAFHNYLSKLGAVKLVDRKEDAALVLRATLKFTEQIEKVVDGIPYSYHCNSRVAYDLFDVGSNRDIAQGVECNARAGADYTTEASVGALLAGALISRKDDLSKILGGLLAVGGVVELQKTIKRANIRCPGIAIRSSLSKLLLQISHVADFSARITNIDYARGLVTLNVGRASGITTDPFGSPMEFEVLIGGRELPSLETNLDASYSVLRVVRSDERSLVCEFRTIKRRVRKDREAFQDTLDLETLKKLPNVRSGVISARAACRFPTPTSESAPTAWYVQVAPNKAFRPSLRQTVRR